MLLENDKDGKLATSTGDLYSETDKLFKATTVQFDSGHMFSPRLSEVPVHELLSEEKHVTHLGDGHNTSFQWYHLPANNMRWVEVLIHKIYKDDLPSCYRILKPERWVKRQHSGPTESPYARFMQPLCELIPSEDDANLTPIREQVNTDKDVVLFMPYLHWDERKAYLERNTVIDNHGKGMDPHWTKEQKLLHQYLYGERSHSLHLLHIRRTLDQFYYHSLKSTKKRDGDQAVSRYQAANFAEIPKVLAVADQLWLWVLVNPSRRAQVVISCFPNRQTSELRNHQSLDPNGKTDILHQIKFCLLQEPQTVRNPYDLVGLITSKCSRAFLDSSIPPGGLQFAEVYESSISNIMNEEAELFDDFNAMSDLRSTVSSATREMIEILGELQSFSVLDNKRTQELKITLQKYYEYTRSQEDGTKIDINDIMNNQSFYFVSEARLLRQIKDIQDELNIISMVFDDQRVMLNKMERIVRSLQSPPLELASQALGNSDDSASIDPNGQLHEHKTAGTHSDQELYGAPVNAGARLDPNFEKADGGAQIAHIVEPNSGNTVNIVSNNGTRDNDMSVAESAKRDIYSVEMWGATHDAPNSSLPLRVVQQCAEDVDMMIQRAERTNRALNFLVDLKQKQSNVMDARATRIQAHASFNMAVEAKKQGATLMIFTVVTIVFLPLSFMAAFFAINITEFQRDAGGNLGLGYVSEIMCKPLKIFKS
ncbi:unnamed protein product [Clonostachys rosea]|uniref:Uncharacterized protein n=1 Tax=Bionectria ochroleuca TaxID=29856 RepID=A0ABY6TUK2_BIOOC|nr:unnamed protein product [Clonostachys rosea]